MRRFGLLPLTRGWGVTTGGAGVARVAGPMQVVGVRSMRFETASAASQTQPAPAAGVVLPTHASVSGGAIGSSHRLPPWSLQRVRSSGIRSRWSCAMRRTFRPMNL